MSTNNTVARTLETKNEAMCGPCGWTLWLVVLVLLLLGLPPSILIADEAQPTVSSWVTLGTAAGPSAAVAKLFAGVDLLVSEVIDVDSAMGQVRVKMPQLQEDQLNQMARHMRENHLAANDAGSLAAEASAGRLVLTHLGNSPDVGVEDRVKQGAARSYSGPIEVARDLDRF